MITNPNENDDEGWMMYSSQSQSAIAAWWKAGCSPEDIAEMIANALSDTGTDCNAELILTERQLDKIERPLRPKAKKGERLEGRDEI